MRNMFRDNMNMGRKIKNLLYTLKTQDIMARKLINTFKNNIMEVFYWSTLLKKLQLKE